MTTPKRPISNALLLELFAEQDRQQGQALAEAMLTRIAPPTNTPEAATEALGITVQRGLPDGA